MAQTKKSVKRPVKPSGRTLQETLPFIYIIGGVIGLFASFILTFDKFKLLENPNYIPNCNINPILSCGSVMKTWEASALGFPNSFLGIAGFAALVTVGVMLLAGAKKMPRWFWLGLELGSALGVILIHWLFVESVFHINALCPYCMVVWAVTIPIFWYTTLHNLRTGVIATPANLKRFVAFLQRHHGDVLFLWFLIIVGFIVNHFWYYWKTIL